MDTNRTAPRGPVRQQPQSKGRAAPAAASMPGVGSAKLRAAGPRTLPPLPAAVKEKRATPPSAQQQQYQGQQDENRANRLGCLFLGDARQTPDAKLTQRPAPSCEHKSTENDTDRRPITGEDASSSFSMPASCTTAPVEFIPEATNLAAKANANARSGGGGGRFHNGAMQELRVAHSVPRTNVPKKQASLDGDETLSATAAAMFDTSTQRAKFERGIEVLNGLVKDDARHADTRAWVTRFLKGNSEARLSKEDLLPVWILVSPEAVLAIDMNGTSQHHNYSDVSASQSAQFPPESGIVFPLQDMIKDGEVRLPQSASEAAMMMMMMTVTGHVRWGFPTGVLFLCERARASIVSDICQMYLPSFLQESYPKGVPLEGHWIPPAAKKTYKKPHVMPLSKCLQEFMLSCIMEVGTSSVVAFSGDGNRLMGEQNSQTTQEYVSTRQPREGKACTSGDDLVTLQPKQQQRCETDDRQEEITSPWESDGTQLIFTARLFTSGATQQSLVPNVACHAVLVLTPRGPLELLVEKPTAAVTVKDIKLSLLRSGLGRSLRLQPDAVRFIYAPDLPALGETEVIGSRYAVLRLQTHK